MNTASPLITIVIAVYNGAGTLRRCLDSLRDQTFDDFEVVVMDGGSTDDTVHILEASEDILTCWRSEPDHGIYDAWNKALSHASGEWVYFLGADDYLLDAQTLADVAPHLRETYPSARIAYGKVALVDRQGQTVRVVGSPWHEARRVLTSRMPIPHQGTFHHRRLFREHGGFDTSYRICGDFEFLLRELLVREPLHFEITVAGMAWGGISTNYDQPWLHLKEIARLRRKHGLFPLSLHLVRHAVGESIFSTLSLVASKSASARVRRAYKRLLGRPV